MLILPIVNRNRVLNVEIKLKNSEKIKTGVVLKDAGESEIIVNGKKFSTSGYNNEKDSKDGVVDFIRNASFRTKKDYFITTREKSNSNTYDVYAVSQPNPKINKALDDLYAEVITDMRKEIPDIKRGRYLSFEKLGIDKHLTDEKIARLQEIVREEKDQTKWPILFKDANIADLKDTIDFINMFDCTVISNTTLPEDTYIATLNALEPLKTEDYRKLKSKYDIAISNAKIYKKLSIINNTLYNRPYTLIGTTKQKENEKQLIKVKENHDYGKVA